MGNTKSSLFRRYNGKSAKTGPGDSSGRGGISARTSNTNPNNTPPGSSGAKQGLPANLSKSTSKFRWEGGRRYHTVKSSTYPLPNDDAEEERLQREHWMLKHVFNGFVLL